MKRAVLLLLLTLPLQPSTSRYDRMPPQKKIELIEKGKLPPGTQLVFGEKELNAFLPAKAKEIAPDGLREPRVEIGDGVVTGYATVDFVKMRHAQGEDMNWLMARLLQGEHPVKVMGRVQSSGGNARVDLDRVEVGDNSIKGRALDVLIKTFVSPIYPNAKVGQQFELGYNVDRIELRPGMARVIMAKKGGLQASR